MVIDPSADPSVSILLVAPRLGGSAEPTNTRRVFRRVRMAPLLALLLLRRLDSAAAAGTLAALPFLLGSIDIRLVLWLRAVIATMPLISAVPTHNQTDTLMIHVPFAGRAKSMVGIDSLRHNLFHLG